MRKEPAVAVPSSSQRSKRAHGPLARSTLHPGYACQRHRVPS
jgi:hypothetical protein